MMLGTAGERKRNARRKNQILYQRRHWLVYNTRKSTTVYEKRLRVFTLATKNIGHQDRSSSLSYKPPLTFNFLFLLLLLIQNKSCLMYFFKAEIKVRVRFGRRRERPDPAGRYHSFVAQHLFSSKCLV